MPLATAAAAISSEVLTADIMIGTTVDSSLLDREMFCSFAAARICPNSSLIAGIYRSVVEIAVIKPCGRCKARMAATIFCMEAFRTSKIPAKNARHHTQCVVDQHGENHVDKVGAQREEIF